MIIQNRYEYDPQKDLLGKGGFARVFRAKDTLLDRQVALKVFNTNAQHNYSVLSEIKKVIQLEHPNLLRYYDVVMLEGQNPLGETEQTQIGVMELANAGDLKDFARANPGSPLLYKLLKGVLMGLEYLHSQGIIHRDLKAQNILLVKGKDGQLTAKISDFGISKDTGSGGQSSSMMVGTIEYMAPEQFAPGKYGIDGKVGSNLDLWSFGIMVHELLTDSTPFGSRDGDTTAEQIMSQILATELPEGIERLPEPYKTVVKKCLVANAKERIRRASELLSYFEGREGAGQQASKTTRGSNDSTWVYPKCGPEASLTSNDNDSTKVYPQADPAGAAPRPGGTAQETKVYHGAGASPPAPGKKAKQNTNKNLLIAAAMAVVIAAGVGALWRQKQVHEDQRIALEHAAEEKERQRVASELDAKRTAHEQEAKQLEEMGTFVILGGGSEVRDTKTDLVWARCSVGLRWEGSKCSGKPKKVGWETARNLEGNGWRLPTIIELDSLIECKTQRVDKFYLCEGGENGIRFRTKVFAEEELGCYWSSTVRNGYVMARCFNDSMSVGSEEGLSANNSREMVRLVRGKM